MSFGREYTNFFLFDRLWQIDEEVIRRDPYRYYKSKKELRKAWNRVNRFLFTSTCVLMFTYRHFRYHNELSRVKGLKITGVSHFSWFPRATGLLIVTYLFGDTFLKDKLTLKRHVIAKIEIQKFDRNHFVYDEYNYVVHNCPVYKDIDSVWGRIYIKRLNKSYNQLPGWIQRRREANPSIEQDVPPKYDFTPEGPRKEDFNSSLNRPLSMFAERF